MTQVEPSGYLIGPAHDGTGSDVPFSHSISRHDQEIPNFVYEFQHKHHIRKAIRC